jgi:hypothetical protein
LATGRAFAFMDQGFQLKLFIIGQIDFIFGYHD